MTGGFEVQTEWQARDTARLFGKPVSVGDKLKEEPCLPRPQLAVMQKTSGRPCPRVALPASLDDAGQLAMMLYQGSESAVPFMLSRRPRARRRMYDRATAALGSSQIAEFIRLQRQALAAARDAEGKS